jgi:hypothetical protein
LWAVTDDDVLMVRGAWLFVRGGESIWIQRSDRGAYELAMHGPSINRHHYSFRDARELGDFLANVEQRLIPAGWTLQRFGPGQDRRSNAPDLRPPGREDRREM